MPRGPFGWPATTSSARALEAFRGDRPDLGARLFAERLPRRAAHGWRARHAAAQAGANTEG